MNLKIILATLLAVPMITSAGVNPKNGDFYITYTDVSLKNNDHELDITRTYNSLSLDIGWFGYGWGSRYETRLVALPDGSAAIKESGNGRITYYRTQSETSIKSGIQSIVAAGTEHDKLTSSAANELATQLLGDEELRLRKVISYGIHVELPKDTALDDVCGKATLTRVTEGYRRIDCNRFGDSEPATDTFDLQGRLIRHELADGYAVTIHYADAGSAEIRDTLGQSISLTWTAEGRVASVKTDKEEGSYAYDANQDLIEFVVKGGNSFRYSYDHNHDLTRITYADDSSMFISYSPRKIGMVDAVTDRNGDQQTFVYRTDPGNPNHMWTKKTVISQTGQTTSKEYEFENQVSSTGATELARTVQTGGGNSKETKYDSQGRVIRKVDASGDVVKYAYHPQNGKIVLVSSNNLKTEFSYNKQGDLVRAENNNGQAINLYYRSTPQIQRIVEINRKDKTRHELKIKYNADSHPVEVTLVGTGKITVEYDEKGEISSVKSTQGAKAAESVAKVFQNMLSVIGAAGVRI